MTSTPEMQKWIVQWCRACTAELCVRSHADGTCPALAAMPSVVGEEVTARWYNEGVKTGVKAAEKHANDLLAALTARVEALEKLIVNEEENRRDAVAHCEFRVEALEHHRHRCADGASWELTTEPTDWMPA